MMFGPAIAAKALDEPQRERLAAAQTETTKHDELLARLERIAELLASQQGVAP
jgi:hypothetical protein